MTKLKSNEYIVFQPDQVLTNTDLNQQFYYLDQQNRWTRNKLLGMGIVCGLDLVYTNNAATQTTTIQINKGCGITSEGYLISKEEDKTYQYAIPYAPLNIPADIPFNCPNLPFYQTQFTNGSGIYKLLTCMDQATIVSNNPGASPQNQPCQDSTTPTDGTTVPGTGTSPASPPSPVSLFSLLTGSSTTYVVVLFLEMKEQNLTSCDMQDCNNGGEEIKFTLTPLLVPQAILTDCKGKIKIFEKKKLSGFPEINLRRYNVNGPSPGSNTPPSSINNTLDILNAFMAITSTANSSVLADVASAYEYCYDKYKNILQLGSDPFNTAFPTNLTNIFNGLTTALSTSGSSTFSLFMTQYFYDYINDLILAYDEFREFASLIDIECCANECCFPLHLILGLATQSTNYVAKTPPRQYFIYSPLFDGGDDSLDKLRFYFNRMSILASQFPSATFPLPPSLLQPNTSPGIKITPSRYENFPLSERAIPYYYPETGNDPNNLYQFWNFKKTLSGNEELNQSYNAYSYLGNPADSVINPLLYDIEKYNFFRIEGHIGLPYTSVLTTLLSNRSIYNLPIDIVAISSELLLTPTGKIPQCNILDLETDFLLLITEFLCKLFLCILDLLFLSATGEKEGREPDYTMIPEYVEKLMTSKLYKAYDYIAVTGVPANSYGDKVVTNYAKGIDVGQQLMDDITCDNLAQSKVSSHVYNLLGSADKVFNTVLGNKLPAMTKAMLQSSMDDFTGSMATLTSSVRVAPTEGINDGAAPVVRGPDIAVIIRKLLDDCCCSCLICIFLELLVLIEEYLKRLLYYEDQLSFLRYYQKHPGLEHKAGVPKGGTFVIVYNQPPTGKYFNTPVVENQAVASVSTDKMILDTKKTYFPQNPSNQNQTIGSLAAGIVIADFYVPYMCCSDCAPVAYILPRVLPTITMNTPLCSDITPPVAITVGPIDTSGKVTSSKMDAAIIKNADGSWSFNPSLLFPDHTTPAYLTALVEIDDNLIYNVNGENSSPLAVTVYRCPDAGFIYTIAPLYTMSLNALVLTANETNASFTYTWTVILDNNPPQVTSGNTNTLTINNIAAFTNANVTLQVTNNTCSNSSTQNIPIPPTLTITPSIFCSCTDSNATPATITVSPANGQINFMDGTPATGFTNNGGTWSFDPSTVEIGITAEELTLIVVYTVNGVSSSPVSVAVYRCPLSGFNFTLTQATNNTLTLVLTAVENSASFPYRWTVTDNNNKSYQGNSLYNTFTVNDIPTNLTSLTVTLNIVNNLDTACTRSSNQTINLPTISIGSAAYCNNDSSSYPVTVTPPNGTLTGTGTSSTNGFSFSPNGLSPGSYTLTYTVGSLSATATVQVSAPPKANFVINVDPQNSNTIDFRNSSGTIVQVSSSENNIGQLYMDIQVQFTNQTQQPNDNTYKWIFAPPQSSSPKIFLNNGLADMTTEVSPTCVYSVPMTKIIKKYGSLTFKAKLNALNAICQSNSSVTNSETIEIAGTFPYVYIECSILTATTSYPIFAYPQGGTLNLSGDTLGQNGGTLSPSGINYQLPNNLTAGNYTLTYTVNGKTSIFKFTIQ